MARISVTGVRTAAALTLLGSSLLAVTNVAQAEDKFLLGLVSTDKGT